MSKISQAVNKLIEDENWEGLRGTAEAALRDAPADHWWLAQLASAYYELRDYRRSLEVVRKAQDVAPDCPLVLWHLAGALSMLDRDQEAVQVYQRLIRVVGKPGPESCHEDSGWNAGVAADAIFRLGRCLEALGNPGGARLLYRGFIELVGFGVPSMYSPADAEARLDKLRPRSRKKAIEDTIRGLAQQAAMAAC